MKSKSGKSSPITSSSLVAPHSVVRSMTGFCSVEGLISGNSYRLEMKALNHRHLDLKLRLPRELSPAEAQVRQVIQARFNRGALEVKFERLGDGTFEIPAIGVNLPLAQAYFAALKQIENTLGLSDSIKARDIASMPEVILRGGTEAATDEAWPATEKLLEAGICRLTEMREHEGAHLVAVLIRDINAMEAALKRISDRREDCQFQYRERVREKVQTIFAAYPMAQESIQGVLETRIAQELAMIMDRTDVQEEVTRFTGHIGHFRKTLTTGGPAGRKLDFILQEMNREINTLGNKAQDLLISEEVVQLKVRLEQVREQVMNLE